MGSPFAMKHRCNPTAMQSSLAPCEMMPSVSSLRDQASRCGRLKKLSGKGILTSGTWRERFCLLVKNKLYYYENDEGNGTEKYCGTVNLDYFDTCTEASTRMARKATNVLVIGSSDKGFFESHSGRHYFSAETLPEMKEWVNAINSAMKNHIRKEKKTTRDGSLTPGQTKRDSSTKTKSKQQDDSPTGTLPRTGARLDNLTKGRPRGPQGRRLPRKPQRPNGTPNETDPVLDSEDEMGVARDSSHGRAATMVESSLETNLKISTKNIVDEQIQMGEESESWDSTESREVDGTDTPDIELIYDYSSSDSNEGSGGEKLCTQKALASGGYIQRRPLSRAGSNIRNSSVTPPPCILRKNRREQESNNNVINPHKPPITNHARDYNSVPTEFGSLHRASSGSSLSTLTADTYSDISNLSMGINGGPFLSLQRNNKAKKPLGNMENGFNSNGAHQQHVFPPTNMKMQIFQHHQRQASSVHGSPLLNNGYMLNHHIQRNGHHSSSQNSSPNNTFDRNGCTFNTNNTNGFQLERNLFSLNKDLESMSQETKQLDADVTGIRQDVGTIQENIVTVRTAANFAQEKMARLQNHVNYVEKQIASLIQEASSMKEQAHDLLDSAKNAQDLQTNLMEEAQSLVAFLKHSANFGPASTYHHQHFNGHFGQHPCPSSPRGTPVPSCCGVSTPRQQSSPVPLNIIRRRGKTPERSMGADEADLSTLNESSVTGGYQQTECYDSLKLRNGKSVISKTSSGGAVNGKRASIVDPLDRKPIVARSPIPCGNQSNSECTKVSHL